MSTAKIRALVAWCGQWDESTGTTDAANEARAIREMCRALVRGGLYYGPNHDGAFIEAVNLVRKIAEEKP